MPTNEESPTIEIDAVVGWTIIRAARRADRLLTQTLRQFDLTPVEFGILSQLAAAPDPATQAEIARAVEIRPQSAAPVIDALNDRGLLNRQGARGKGRSGRLVLTKPGAQLVAALFPVVIATNTAILDDAVSVGQTNAALLAFISRVQGADA